MPLRVLAVLEVLNEIESTNERTVAHFQDFVRPCVVVVVDEMRALRLDEIVEGIGLNHDARHDCAVREQVFRCICGLAEGVRGGRLVPEHVLSVHFVQSSALIAGSCKAAFAIFLKAIGFPIYVGCS